MRFLTIWLIGDIFNIVGVAMEKLLVTMLILAVYYTATTTILILQVLYYRHEEYERLSNGGRRNHTNLRSIDDIDDIDDEEDDDDDDDDDDPSTTTSCTHDDIQKIFVVTLIITSAVLISVLCIQCVAQYFGWCSAILYVGSRLPQITKNRRNESTKGLALGMFVFGILGNVLYCASIFLQSTERDYIKQNLPWLVGSGGTMFLDVFIGIQFAWYRRKSTTEGSSAPSLADLVEPV